jgi:hypothetical protein
MRIERGARAVASVICWTISVIVLVVSAGGFAGGGVPCQSGAAESCDPRTWVLVGGVVVGVAFGVAGAMLYRPRRTEDRRKPWEY